MNCDYFPDDSWVVVHSWTSCRTLDKYARSSLPQPYRPEMNEMNRGNEVNWVINEMYDMNDINEIYEWNE